MCLGPWFPQGYRGVFVALPAAFWWFTGFEAVVLTGAECKEPEKTMPRSLFASFGTLALCILPIIFGVGCSGPGM